MASPGKRQNSLQDREFEGQQEGESGILPTALSGASWRNSRGNQLGSEWLNLCEMCFLPLFPHLCLPQTSLALHFPSFGRGPERFRDNWIMPGLPSAGAVTNRHTWVTGATWKSSWKRGREGIWGREGIFRGKILKSWWKQEFFRVFGLSCFFGTLRPRQGFLSNPPNPIFSLLAAAEDAAGEGNDSLCCC